VTRKVCLPRVACATHTPYDQFSSFSRLKRVTAWVFRFIKGCRRRERKSSTLTGDELASAELSRSLPSGNSRDRVRDNC
jgi:hypothetical protein